MKEFIKRFFMVRRLRKRYLVSHNNMVYYLSHKMYANAESEEKYCYGVWNMLYDMGKIAMADRMSMKAYKDFDKKNLKLKRF